MERFGGWVGRGMDNGGGEWRELGKSGVMGAGGTPSLGDEGFCRAPRLSSLTDRCGPLVSSDSTGPGRTT